MWAVDSTSSGGDFRDAVRRLVREVGAVLRDTAPARPPEQGLEILMPPLLSIRKRILFDVYEAQRLVTGIQFR